MHALTQKFTQLSRSNQIFPAIESLPLNVFSGRSYVPFQGFGKSFSWRMCIPKETFNWINRESDFPKTF